MKKRMWRAVRTLLIICAGGTGALWAHPHVFIRTKVTFQWQKGVLQRAHITWEFDPFFSADIISGYDTNKDGLFDKKETQQVFEMPSSIPNTILSLPSSVPGSRMRDVLALKQHVQVPSQCSISRSVRKTVRCLITSPLTFLATSTLSPHPQEPGEHCILHSMTTHFSATFVMQNTTPYALCAIRRACSLPTKLLKTEPLLCTTTPSIA